MERNGKEENVSDKKRSEGERNRSVKKSSDEWKEQMAKGSEV